MTMVFKSNLAGLEIKVKRKSKLGTEQDRVRHTASSHLIRHFLYFCILAVDNFFSVIGCHVVI